jgi:ABC-type uncharacterized transport system substrate-binding protein
MTAVRSLALRWLLAVACLASGVSPVWADTRVVVVSGVAASVTDEFVGALQQGLGKAATVKVVSVAERVAAYEGAQLLIPLGTAALSAVVADSSELPILAALVPRTVFERIRRNPGTRISALYLGQSYVRQLAVARAALPRARRIGVLAGPDSAQSLNWLGKAAREAGLSLTVERGEGDRLHAALRTVIAGSDLLLAVPDPQVFNASSIQGILLETYRAGIPVVGISPAYTRAGAIYSLSVSPIQLGAEAARMARQAIDGPWPESRYAEDFEVHVNRQVARSLGIELPGDEVLQAAAREAR